MPVVACPKCATNLKVPDGASGSVKCPKCNTIFPIAAKPAPAFEVVDDAPAPQPAPRPAPKPAPLEPDFEVVDEPKPRKKVAVEDDDDYDDRPRGRRRRDDDDEDDDRRRKKKKRRRDYDDEYDDEEDWRPAARGSSFGPARVGMLLISISLWMYVGTFTLLALFLLIAWVGASIPSALLIITGLLGLANWIVALIGLGFTIAGPARSRGLAIAATAVAGVHLILAFVVANDSKTVNPATAMVALQSFSSKADRLKSLSEKIQKETDPTRRRDLEKELRESFEDGGDSFGVGRKSEMRWPDLASLVVYADILIAELSYNSKGFSDYVLSLLSGLVEVARLILIILLIGAVGRAARDNEVGERSTIATISASVGIGVAMFIFLIVTVILHESSSSKSGTGKSGMNWMTAGVLIVFLIHLGTLILPAILGMQAKDAAARRR